jgi:hypothetical protein
MGPFLTAVLISVCIALYVASAQEITAKEVLLSALPAWLQGVGTVGAAYVAWRAFATWREQDTWRRRADFADQVLRSAHRLGGLIDAMRGRVSGSVYGSAGPNEKDVEVLANDPRRPEEVRRIVEASGELRSYIALAKRDFGADVEGAMHAVASLAYHVNRAHGGLQDMNRLATDLKVPANKEVARKHCSVLGVHFYDLAIDDPRLRDMDEFGDMRMLFVRGLEEKLLPYR